ncbi:5'/3'-nucleotidase SurE [Actibacterium pelagium]|uniref:5'-nucleotidase SurE n=1 Tax=Actibacterium pelagium TaxID=2029103 RepID=A0A917ADT6_9RHOB|nr:5'/3'-nucleotidase SurE [Actibacterium pelagium]GGE46232.1 5'-nucleotidase SurE [Actibacterium pelagium]
MRILLTNDDGINAPGLEVLQAIAADIAGPNGEVWTVAPAFEQSGVAHCISYTRPFMVSELSERRFAAEGTPADCVIAALYDIMQETPPDLVLSGVNRGNNSGENAMYSGTLGAAMEAALQGLPAIALSQYLGPKTYGKPYQFEAAAQHGAATVRKLLEHGAWDEGDYRLFYNVNFPPCRGDEVSGLRVSPKGFRRDTYFRVVPQDSPTGRRFLWVTGGNQQGPTLPGSDVAENLNGYISVTPMRADLTAHDQLSGLKERLE